MFSMMYLIHAPIVIVGLIYPIPLEANMLQMEDNHSYYLLPSEMTGDFYLPNKESRITAG